MSKKKQPKRPKSPTPFRSPAAAVGYEAKHGKGSWYYNVQRKKKK